jgi:peptidyl-prolyl cis-trans isomerase SurA
VNAVPIFRGEVLLELRQITSSAEANEDSRATLQAQILRQLVDRQLVLEHLARNRLGASQQDVDFELRRLTQRLAQRGGKTLDDYLAERGLPIEALRRRLAWQLGWPRYLQRHLSEEQLKQHFERHRRDYDGTQIRVAHILLRVSDGQGIADVGAPLPMALSRAKTIRHEIESGAVTFADAARKYSEAPTAADGGNLGVIGRHQPMSEDFSRAAFALTAGEISQPTVTKFGVHLIHCQEVTPGKLGWRDVQEQLQKDVAIEVFQELASDARRGARVEFTGSMPYFDPASGALVPGGS